MSCKAPETDAAIALVVDHNGLAQVESCRDLTLGAVGLILAEHVAALCAQYPATAADRIAVERNRS